MSVCVKFFLSMAAIPLPRVSFGEIEETSIIFLAPILRWDFSFPALAFPNPRFGEQHDGFP